MVQVLEAIICCLQSSFIHSFYTKIIQIYRYIYENKCKPHSQAYGLERLKCVKIKVIGFIDNKSSMAFCNFFYLCQFRFKFKSIIRKCDENKQKYYTEWNILPHNTERFCSRCLYVHNVITVIAFPLKAMDSADAFPTCWRFYYGCLEIDVLRRTI